MRLRFSIRHLRWVFLALYTLIVLACFGVSPAATSSEGIPFLIFVLILLAVQALFIFGAGTAIAIRVWWLIPVYIVGFALFYWPTIANEQRFLMGKFGDEYADYCRRVPSFIPWKFSRGTGNFSFRNAMVNREHLHALASVIFLAVLTLVGHFRA